MKEKPDGKSLGAKGGSVQRIVLRPLRRARLTQCPDCGSKRYTWVEKPTVINRKAVCLVCGRGFGKLDARRLART